MSDNLLLGQQIAYPESNRLKRSADGIAPGKRFKSIILTIIFLIIISVLLGIFVDVGEGSNFVLRSVAFMFILSPIVIWSISTQIMSSVTYTATLEDVAELNEGKLRVANSNARGVIGRLVSAHADQRKDDNRLTTRLSVRNDQDNTAWGIESVDQGDHGFFIGRQYTTGPYRGFGYISIKMPEKTRNFPQLIIDASKNNHNFTATNLVGSLGKEQQYSMEGNFPDYFRVYALNDQIARVAYYVLTPDIMQKLIKYAPEFDIEVDNNRLNLYWYDSSLESELRPDWISFLPKAFGLLEQVVMPLSKRIELYRLEPHTSGRQLIVNNDALLSSVRNITYGRRQNLDTAAARISRTSAIIGTASGVMVAVLSIVILVLLSVYGIYSI